MKLTTHLVFIQPEPSKSWRCSAEGLRQFANQPMLHKDGRRGYLDRVDVCTQSRYSRCWPKDSSSVVSLRALLAPREVRVPLVCPLLHQCPCLPLSRLSPLFPINGPLGLSRGFPLETSQALDLDSSRAGLATGDCMLCTEYCVFVCTEYVCVHADIIPRWVSKVREEEACIKQNHRSFEGPKSL